MALSGIINSILDSAESLADTTAKAADSKFQAITTIAIALVAVIAFLIIFAVDSTAAMILAVIAVVGVYLLDIDVGGDSSSGPRK